MNYRYTYDTMDNITAKQTEHGNYSYEYDALYRLIDVGNPDVSGLADEAFTYDNVGNRLTSAEAAGAWTYNGNNELESNPEATYEYDANGNMIKKTVDGVVTSYVYNIEDRLVEVWDGEVGSGSLIALYYYAPFGRRLWKDVGGTRTYYHYADEGLVAEMDSAGNVGKSYGYKPGSVWGTDPLFMKAGAQYYFYHNDHLGTPQKMTSKSGAVVWSAKYEAFGKAQVATASTVVNNLRFPGQYFDEETGLHYNMWRYYDAGVGRYFRDDPIGLNGGINLYTYAQLNSINLYDPLGLLGGGIGGYYGGGAEISYGQSTCCEKDKKYNVKVLTVCGGVGIGVKGAIPVSVSASSISSRTGCPRTRYYFKHENTFILRSANVQGDSHGPSAGIDAGIYGIATIWVFCSDTVISKTDIGCCDN